MAQAMLDQVNLTTELQEEIPAKQETAGKRRSKRAAKTTVKRALNDEQHDQTEDKPAGQGKCIWCLKLKNLLPRKKFCAECGSQGCECAYCHRPMPERFYKFSKRLCNACFNKSEKQKAKRRRLTTMGFFSL